MSATKQKALSRERRRNRVRRAVRGTAERPRLTVFRSSKHIYAQVIDDDRGQTLASASTVSPELKGKVTYGGNAAAAEAVGRLLAEKAKAAGVEKERTLPLVTVSVNDSGSAAPLPWPACCFPRLLLAICWAWFLPS